MRCSQSVDFFLIYLTRITCSRWQTKHLTQRGSSKSTNHQLELKYVFDKWSFTNNRALQIMVNQNYHNSLKLTSIYCPQWQTRSLRRGGSASFGWGKCVGEGTSAIRDDLATSNGERAAAGSAGACEGELYHITHYCLINSTKSYERYWFIHFVIQIGTLEEQSKGIVY